MAKFKFHGFKENEHEFQEKLMVNRCIFLLNLTRRMLCSIQTDLLFLGAPIDYMTVDGSNARDLAESNGHEICARRLREAESRANNKNYC